MQKHAMALGYFSLAVFCVHVSEHIFGHRPSILIPLLMIAAMLAGVVGAAFFIAASITQFRSAAALTTRLIRDARQPPARVQASAVRPINP